MTSPNSTTGKGVPKPDVPADFPLWWHPSGRWCKKIRGKAHYFGKDPDAALDQWLRVKDALLAGRTPPEASDAITIAELAYDFLVAKKRKLDRGALSHHTYRGYHKICTRLVKFFGKTFPADATRPDDFSRLLADFAKTHGPAALVTDVQMVKTVFKWGFESELLPRAVRFGPDFQRPSKREIREARNGKTRLIEAADLRRIIDAAGQPLKTMIVLALNTGFGPADIGRLPFSALNLDAGWVDFPRVKTAIRRLIPLWPETVALLRDAIRLRPNPQNPSAAERVFLTRRGLPWEGNTCQNLIGRRFRDILRQLKLHRPGRSFYSCRHILETIGGDTADQVAVDSVMGHRRGDMAENYRHGVSDDRLRAVVNHVRAWLWPPDQTAGDEQPATILYTCRKSG